MCLVMMSSFLSAMPWRYVRYMSWVTTTRLRGSNSNEVKYRSCRLALERPACMGRSVAMATQQLDCHDSHQSEMSVPSKFRALQPESGMYGAYYVFMRMNIRMFERP